jgi:hypothetical protein
MADPTLQRLDEQIAWYDQKSIYNQRAFIVFKTILLLAAAAIPVLGAIASVPRMVLGIVGAGVVFIEAFQQLNHYHENWILYRGTCETLKHEKYLFLASASIYETAVNPRKLLAERIEGLVSQENAKWVSVQQQLPNQTISRDAPAKNSTPP